MFGGSVRLQGLFLDVFHTLATADSQSFEQTISFHLNLKRIFRSRESRSRSPLPTASPQTAEPFCGYSSQAAPPQDPPGQPVQTIIGSVSTATNIPVPPGPIGEGQNYGIKELYNGGTEASVDIVFVHGLTGNAYNTWLHKETGIHWPSKLLGQDIPDSRILSFGYDADVVNILGGGPASYSRLSNHAESLVGQLVRARQWNETETRKIIFVAHSLGGLVTEQALTHSKNSAEPHLNQVERYTIRIVFLGVPHCGSNLEAWAIFGRRIISILKRINKNILSVLNPNSEMLHMVENSFHINLR